MQWYEVDACLNGLDYKNRIGWEQTRLISYIQAQTQSTRKLRPTDIIKFDWDNSVEKDTAITNEDIQRLREKALQTINELK